MSNETDRPTPPPWWSRLVTGTAATRIYCVENGKTVLVAECVYPGGQHAEIILRAVNSHDKLVEALARATDRLSETNGLVGIPMLAKHRGNFEADTRDIVRDSLAALALAGGN